VAAITYPPGNPSGRADYSSSRDVHMADGRRLRAPDNVATLMREPFAHFTLAVCSESYGAGIGASMRTSYA